MIRTRRRAMRGRLHRGSAESESSHRSRLVSLLLVILLPVLTSGSDVRAAAPELMSYQGVLTDGDGRVVENGLYGLTFQVFEVATSGTSIWAQTLSVQVEDGLYNVILSQPGLATALSSSPRFIEVRIDSGPGIPSAVTLSPRQQLSSVPYALRAVEADKTTPGPWIPLQLQNGWVPFGQGWPGPAYFKDGAGIVHLRGMITGGDSTVHAIILTLPSGARPEERQMFVVYTADSVQRPGAIDVAPAGGVIGRSVGSTWLSLDTIQFRAAQP